VSTLKGGRNLGRRKLRVLAREAALDFGDLHVLTDLSHKISLRVPAATVKRWS
jgi:hypothetical protein